MINDRSQNVIISSLAHASSIRQVSRKSVHNFWVTLLTDRQTNQQKWKYYSFGRGNKALYNFCATAEHLVSQYGLALELKSCSF